MIVEVRGRIPGRDRDEMPEVRVEAGEGTTVGDLIGRAVAEQVRLLAADRAQCRVVLDRQYLTADDIRAQAAAGAVRMREPAQREPAPPDAGAEAARARAAFGKGAFAVFVGGRQLHGLDEPVAARPGEVVVFLRLVPLAGG
ncbi:MAG TPA: hypothetical protein VL738_01785 [Dactylosporangium sp.]|jgi:hypothetical protein|nr:hypothetical protein [Dactylosporangium sp.]